MYHSQQLRRSARDPRPIVADEHQAHLNMLLMMWMGDTLSWLSLIGRGNNKKNLPLALKKSGSSFSDQMHV